MGNELQYELFILSRLHQFSHSLVSFNLGLFGEIPIQSALERNLPGDELVLRPPISVLLFWLFASNWRLSGKACLWLGAKSSVGENGYSQVPLISVAWCWSTPAEQLWPSMPGVTTWYKLVTHNIWVTICASMFPSVLSNHVRCGPWTLPQFISLAQNERMVFCKGWFVPP